MKEKKRLVDIVVVSDVHLGTYGSHAKELNSYLKSIKPKMLILNGDIIDIWQFRKYYWPKPHMKVVKQIIGMAAKGTQVFYITGNHDETLRKFSGIKMGNLEIVNKLELKIGDKRAWIFHGDVFDVIMQHSKWLAKAGALGYDFLVILNVFVNFISRMLGRGRVSLSKRIKDNVKTAVKYINNFEDTAATLAISKGFDYIICGHIHQPDMRIIKDIKGNTIQYLNSGDWIENLSSLEYHDGEWRIYKFREDKSMQTETEEFEDPASSITDLDNKEIFRQMVADFQS
jgi:UDP-2,3-diacylglucosamine pyrophosphatase LpxH